MMKKNLALSDILVRRFLVSFIPIRKRILSEYQKRNNIFLHKVLK